MPRAPIGFGATSDYLTIIETGRKVVAASGTGEQVATSGSGVVIIQAFSANTGVIRLGGPTVAGAVWSATASSRRGLELEAGQSLTLPVRELTSIYIDASVSGEGVDYVILG